MKMPPLLPDDRAVMEELKLTRTPLGGIIYKGVYIAVAYSTEVKAYFFIVNGINKYDYVWSLRKVVAWIDKVCEIGEPWD